MPAGDLQPRARRGCPMLVRGMLSLLAAAAIAMPAIASQPVADARSHEFLTRYVEVGQGVSLDGTASYGRGCDLSYTWTMVSRPEGSGAALVGANSAKPKFVADREGDFVVDLVVSDSSGTSDPARVTVSAMQCTVGSILVPCAYPLPAKNAERWMQLTPGLMAKTLREITLPGTHDSGAYWLNEAQRGPDYNDQGFSTTWWQDVALWLGGSDEDEIKNEVANDVSRAQDRTLLEQLNGGIRYFDLRVTIRGGVFYTYHGLLGQPLTALLQDIRTFMERSEAELVVVDVSHLNVGTHETNDHRAFTEGEHQLLMHALIDQLGPFLYWRNGQSRDDLLATPMGQVVADGPKVLVLYADLPDEVVDPNAAAFWPGSLWTGGFTNTEKMRDSLGCPRDADQDERGQFDDQKCQATTYAEGGMEIPFVLHQTLTAHENDVVTNAAKCRAGQHLPVWPPIPVGAAKLYLESFCDETRTLHGLSRAVNRNLPQMLDAIVPVRPGLIRVDFFEESAVVSEAVRLNQGDVVPPRTDASIVPPPNQHDCNTTSVTVKLVGWDDEGGSGVKEIHHWMTGASEPNTVATCGSQVDVSIDAKGVTELHYYGVDRDGNAEAQKTVQVSIAPGGDLTGDCRVQRDDVYELMRSIVQRAIPASADADGDGRFTTRDFALMLCAVRGLNCPL